jgi:hypothetical protein
VLKGTIPQIVSVAFLLEGWVAGAVAWIAQIFSTDFKIRKWDSRICAGKNVRLVHQIARILPNAALLCRAKAHTFRHKQKKPRQLNELPGLFLFMSDKKNY